MIFLVGCTQVDLVIVRADLGDPFQLKINQIGYIKSENIKIVFLNVTEDSRCPSDVDCIWPGQVTILINITKDNKDTGEYNLTLGTDFDERAIKEFDGYSIKLMIVDPYPISTQEIELTDYIITLNVTIR
jgi:hypothetical protein